MPFGVAYFPVLDKNEYNRYPVQCLTVPSQKKFLFLRLILVGIQGAAITSPPLTIHIQMEADGGGFHTSPTRMAPPTAAPDPEDQLTLVPIIVLITSSVHTVFIIFHESAMKIVQKAINKPASCTNA